MSCSSRCFDSFLWTHSIIADTNQPQSSAFTAHSHLLLSVCDVFSTSWYCYVPIVLQAPPAVRFITATICHPHHSFSVAFPWYVALLSLIWCSHHSLLSPIAHAYSLSATRRLTRAVLYWGHIMWRSCSLLWACRSLMWVEIGKKVCERKRTEGDRKCVKEQEREQEQTG